jgi:hypothetical protein
MTDNALAALLARVGVKRSIFVSYHHGKDRGFYEPFSALFADSYQVIEDNSVGRAIDSEDAEYVHRRIREAFIAGSSCTVVLCGAATWQRKFVEWEVKTTLDKQHGLIAVQLPTNPTFTIPLRLHDNTQTGYALWSAWHELTARPSILAGLVEMANNRSKVLIRNDREMRIRNG